MTVVLDASIAIKLYALEPGSDLAVEWLERDIDYAAPDIFLVEVAQALLRHTRAGLLGRTELSAAVKELAARAVIPFSSGQLIQRALALAHQLDHRLHDCMYLALAERLTCPMLTADERLVRKVRGAPSLPIPILLLTDPIP